MSTSEKPHWLEQAKTSPALVREMQLRSMEIDIQKLQSKSIANTPILSGMLSDPQGWRLEQMMDQIVASFSGAPVNSRVFEELIVFGPSGSGKTTLTKDLLFVFNQRLKELRNPPRIIVQDYADSLEIARDRLGKVKNKVGYMPDEDYFHAQPIDTRIGNLIHDYVDESVLVLREGILVSQLFKHDRYGNYQGISGIPRISLHELRNRVGDNASIRILALIMKEKDRRDLVQKRQSTTRVPHKDGNPLVSGQQVDDMLRAMTDMFAEGDWISRPPRVPRGLNPLRRAIVRQPELVPKLIRECVLPNLAYGLYGSKESVRAAYTVNKRLPEYMVTEAKDEELQRLFDQSRAVNVLRRIALTGGVDKTPLINELKDLKVIPGRKDKYKDRLVLNP